MSSLTVTAASRNARSVAARSPHSQCQMWLSCLSFLSVRSTGAPGLERLLRIDDHRERLVLDLDRVGAVGRDVALGRQDRRDLLGLVHHLLHRQHHLRVRHEGRHPVEVVLGEVLAGDDREDAGDRERLGRVDLDDLRVRVRAPHDVEVEHAGQLDVVDVRPLAADEARVLLALDRVAHAADLGRRARSVLGRHHAPPSQLGRPAGPPRAGWP